MKRIQRLRRVATKNTEPSRTDQQYKKECDVNEIVKKFKRTGQVTHLAKSQGHYADVSEYPDLLRAFEVARIAEDAFSALPAHIRKRFGTKENYVQFLEDPRNDEEAVKLGLKVARQTSDKSPEAPKKSSKKEKSDDKSQNSASADA